MEMELLQGLQRGATVEELAQRMSIREGSVRVLAHEAKRKLGLRKIDSLIRGQGTRVDLTTGIIGKRATLLPTLLGQSSGRGSGP